MATIISHNILSPLGFGSEENYNAVKNGKSSLRRYEKAFGTPLTIMASLFSDEQKENIKVDGLSIFESFILHSITDALNKTNLNITGSDSCLIISTTKGNINQLGIDPDELILPGTSAKKIAAKLGFSTLPIVVCNACISGVSALVLASRMIDRGIYRNIVVCGCDILGRFTISGFESLRALSPDECRPFDEERIGLNLGEAAATIVLSTEGGAWHIDGGAVRNDAFHISTPSSKGVGSALAAKTALKDGKENLAFVNLHGTATMYNDQMEWMALKSAGLTDISANALKGYYGHTMGAAGVLECIISMMAVDDHNILGTRGFNLSGVSGNINICPTNQLTEKKSFLKLISGFGGCNGAILFTNREDCRLSVNEAVHTKELCSVKVTNSSVIINGNLISTDNKGKELLSELYKKYVGNYPKFYKMDILSKLGLIVSELLYKNSNIDDKGNETAVILFNHSSSINADKDFYATICNADDFYPSPSIFVYTLPNIVNGEMALKHSIHLETAFYVLPEYNKEAIDKIVNATLQDAEIKYCINGWIECINSQNFEAEIQLIEKIIK